jgi:quinoprotein glucose dehydrogenase
MSLSRARRPARLLPALAACVAAACTAEPPPPRDVAADWSLGAEPTATFAPVGDWPTYNRDLAGTRYSGLEQLDPDNVADLQLAWSYPLGRNATSGTEHGGSQLTPLVVANVMYAATADAVVALRADSGAQLWRHALDRGVPSRRGLAYWPGVNELRPRIFFTSGRRLIALDAQTGQRATGFGADGEIDMEVSYNGAPTLFEHFLLVGSDSAPGSVRAFDVRNGAPLWVFQSVPRPWEAGHDSWQSEAWREQPGVLHSPFALTVDVDRAILYAAFASPGPHDHYGGDRPGDNLFGNSIVALDVRTGVRKWHLQTVRHDLWDYDLPAAPSLVDLRVGASLVPALAQPSKQGYMYLLNRVTGAPLFGIEERAVPRSDVPGERAAPTQPVPLLPSPLARVVFAAEDLVTAEDTTAEHAARCRDLQTRSGGVHNAGPFTPLAYRAPESEPRSAVMFPGAFGGGSWGGTAVDPERGLVFVSTTSLGTLGWLEDAPAADSSAKTGPSAAPVRAMSAQGEALALFWADGAPPSDGAAGGEPPWPCQKPPWGELMAIEAATGAIAWRVPLGVTEQLPENRQRTGRPNVGGPIATAGGLVFIGATNDRRFRAFAAATGEELWTAPLPLSAHAVPITYAAASGKQHVAIVAGGASVIDRTDPAAGETLMVYALP